MSGKLTNDTGGRHYCTGDIGWISDLDRPEYEALGWKPVMDKGIERVSPNSAHTLMYVDITDAFQMIHPIGKGPLPRLQAKGLVS